MIGLFFIGMALGAVTGIPIGPVNVAVIDAAYRHCLRRALFVALGGAVADSAYAFLGIVVMGPLLERHPMIPPSLYLASGVLLVVYGWMTARARPAGELPSSEARTISDSQHGWEGFALGFALIVMNPAALVTWVVIVGTSLTGVVDQAGGIACSIGIGVGSICWFTFVAYLADHGTRALGDKAVWITRIVGVALVGYGIFSIGRGAWIFLR